jgi:hypothetical protein
LPDVVADPGAMRQYFNYLQIFIRGLTYKKTRISNNYIPSRPWYGIGTDAIFTDRGLTNALLMLAGEAFSQQSGEQFVTISPGSTSKSLITRSDWNFLFVTLSLP